jgi:hypothetical protein
LASVAGQIDVTFNVDPGTQTLSEVDLVMNCTGPGNSGTDTVVATQSLTSSAIAAQREADASAIAVSFNTATFAAATGAVAFKNGSCAVKGRAVTLSGTTATKTQSGTTQITLTNADVVVIAPAISTTPTGVQLASATGANGLLWNAGAVNVTAVPVIYTPSRTIVSATINLVNGGGNAALGQNGVAVASQGVVASISGAPANGVLAATFPNSTTAPGGVGGATVDTLVVTVTTVDNAGHAGPSLANPVAGGVITGGPFMRLDNRAPDITGTAFNPNTQNTSNGWVGANFAFSLVAGSITLGPNTLGDANGIQKVFFQTQSAPSGTTKFTTFTNVNTLTETSTTTGPSAYDLRLNICDALNNCAITGVLTTFGVDLTPPIASVNTGPRPFETVGIGQTLTNNGSIVLSATEPPGASGATGSGFGPTPALVSETKLAPSGSGQALSCVIGTQDNTGNCSAPQPMALTFLAVTAAPGQYALTVSVVDRAGNQSPSVTLQFYVDQAAPSVTGTLTVPGSVTVGTAFTALASDDMDVVGSNGVLRYPIALGSISADTRIIVPGGTNPAGVAFDNTLTRTSTATVTLASSQWYRSLGTISGGAITGGVKPNAIGIRAIDAANNLSAQNQAPIPPGSVSSGTGAPYTIGTDLNDFSIAASPTSVSNGNGTGASSTTFTASVTAASATANTPFTSVCFYVVSPNGTEGALANAVTLGAAKELSLLGCSTTPALTTVGSNRVFQYTMSYDPPAAFGTSGSLSIVAIGTNANADGLVTSTPAVVTLIP